MAYLQCKNGKFHVRFRFNGRQYQRSLRTKAADAAQATLGSIEQMLYLIRCGQKEIPSGVCVADFVLSNGTLTVPTGSRKAAPTLADAVNEYLASCKNKSADSYISSQRTHLRHLVKHLGRRSQRPIDQVTKRQLEQFLGARLRIRQPNTVIRERNTLQQVFGWAESQSYLSTSPAADLSAITGGDEQPPFRTVAEIESAISCGGLSDKEVRELWKRLYLGPNEIADLLDAVRQNSTNPNSYLLHAIPAYTGMRRSEVLKLQWVDVDFEQKFITARSRKQSRRVRESLRRIDLHQDLLRELRTHREQHSRGQLVLSEGSARAQLSTDKANRLLWQPMRETSWCLERAMNRFKIGFHTYRHSFASNLAATGVDQRVIDEFMGHQTEAMRRRYRHLFPADRRSAVESLEYKSGPNGKE